MGRAEAHGRDRLAVGDGRQLPGRVPEIGWRDAESSGGRLTDERFGDRRRFGCDARDMDERDGTTRGSGGAERLELVLRCRRGEAVDHRDVAPRVEADDVAEQRIECILAERAVRDAVQARGTVARRPSSVWRPTAGTRPVSAAAMSVKSPYRSVRAPSTEFANAIAFDSPHAICSPKAGRCGSW